MKCPLLLLSAVLCACLPLGALTVRQDESCTPQAREQVLRAVEYVLGEEKGEDLEVTLSSFSQDERVTSIEVTLFRGNEWVVEKPMVPTKGWKGKLQSLLKRQLSYDLGKLYPAPKQAIILDELYMARPLENSPFRTGQVYKSYGDGTCTGLLAVRNVYPEVVRFDALYDHGVRIGQTLSRAAGQSVEGWVSLMPRGGELSWRMCWPYPFQLSFALGSLDGRMLFEAGLERVWPLSSLSRAWFFRNSSIGAGVRAGISSPFSIGASASITWRLMVWGGFSLAVSGRLLYYGIQEEKRSWQDGYQLLCGVGYHW